MTGYIRKRPVARDPKFARLPELGESRATSRSWHPPGLRFFVFQVLDPEPLSVRYSLISKFRLINPQDFRILARPRNIKFRVEDYYQGRLRR